MKKQFLLLISIFLSTFISAQVEINKDGSVNIPTTPTINSMSATDSVLVSSLTPTIKRISFAEFISGISGLGDQTYTAGAGLSLDGSNEFSLAATTQAEIDANTAKGGGDLFADGSVAMINDFDLNGNDLNNINRAYFGSTSIIENGSGDFVISPDGLFVNELIFENSLDEWRIGTSPIITAANAAENGIGTGTATPTNLTVNSYQELRDIANPQEWDVRFLEDDLRYGFFYYRGKFASVDNGGTIINGWARLDYYRLRPRYYGAVGDWDFATQTGTDDTIALNNMILEAPNSGENVNAFADPTAIIDFDPNKRYMITDEIVVSERNMLIKGNESTIFNNSADKFAIRIQNARKVQIENLNISLLNDNLGVGGVYMYKTYQIELDNVDVYADEYLGAKHINTFGYKLETGVGDIGDNLYNKFYNFSFRKIGTGFYASTDDLEPDFSRTNSTSLVNGEFLANSTAIHLRGVWGVEGLSLDVESDENFRFETNNQGLGTRYNKFGVKWTEGSGVGNNFADAASFDNEIEVMYYGNVRDGIIPVNQFTFPLNNQNVTHGDLIRNKDFDFNLVRISDFSVDRVWIKTDAQITGGQGILSVTNDSYSQLEYLIKYTPDYYYEVEIEAYSDLDGARLRTVDHPANTGGMVAGVEAGKTQGLITLGTTPQTYKLRFRANENSQGLSLVRGGGDGTTTTYQIFIDSISVKRIIPTTEEENTWKETQTFSKSIVATQGVVVPNAPEGSYIRADGTTGIPGSVTNTVSDSTNIIGLTWTTSGAVTETNGQLDFVITSGGYQFAENLFSYENGFDYILEAKLLGDAGGGVKFQDNGNNAGVLQAGDTATELTGVEQKIRFEFTPNAESVGLNISRQNISGGLTDYNFSVYDITVKKVNYKGHVIAESVAIPNLPNATSLATDAQGNIIEGTAGGAGETAAETLLRDNQALPPLRVDRPTDLTLSRLNLTVASGNDIGRKVLNSDAIGITYTLGSDFLVNDIIPFETIGTANSNIVPPNGDSFLLNGETTTGGATLDGNYNLHFARKVGANLWDVVSDGVAAYSLTPPNLYPSGNFASPGADEAISIGGWTDNATSYVLGTPTASDGNYFGGFFNADNAGFARHSIDITGLNSANSHTLTVDVNQIQGDSGRIYVSEVGTTTALTGVTINAAAAPFFLQDTPGWVTLTVVIPSGNTGFRLDVMNELTAPNNNDANIDVGEELIGVDNIILIEN